MKEGRPVVVARQPEDEALRELLKRAAERGSEVIQVPDKANVASKVGHVLFFFFVARVGSDQEVLAKHVREVLIRDQGIIDLEGRRQQRVVVSTREGISGRTDEEAGAHQSGVPCIGCDVHLACDHREVDFCQHSCDHGRHVQEQRSIYSSWVTIS